MCDQFLEFLIHHHWLCLVFSIYFKPFICGSNRRRTNIKHLNKTRNFHFDFFCYVAAYAMVGSVKYTLHTNTLIFELCALCALLIAYSSSINRYFMVFFSMFLKSQNQMQSQSALNLYLIWQKNAFNLHSHTELECVGAPPVKMYAIEIKQPKKNQFRIHIFDRFSSTR